MTREDAIKLCELFDVNYSEHPKIIVTSNNNIYLTGNVDPADKGERFELNVEDVEVDLITDPEVSEEGSELKENKKEKKKNGAK